MPRTLVDSVTSVFTDPLLSKYAALLDEPASNVQKAVQAAIPLVLTDILNKAYFPEGIAKIRTLSTQAAAGDFSGAMHEFTVNRSPHFGASLLGGHMDPVIGEISRYADISVSAASFITGITSFIALSAIGRLAANADPDDAGLAARLKTQGNSIRRALPAGLKGRTALGLHHYPWEKIVTNRKRNTNRYIIVLLITLVLLTVFFLVFLRTFRQG